MLREPAGHHAVVGRESGRFEDPGDGTQANQRQQSGGKALEQGGNGPAKNRDAVGGARA
ncbi:hypothetical protein D3C72_698180 [compost metagenome]